MTWGGVAFGCGPRECTVPRREEGGGRAPERGERAGQQGKSKYNLAKTTLEWEHLECFAEYFRGFPFYPHDLPR